MLLCARLALADGTTLAFPGAAGAAATTPGGRGGEIVRVTTLAPNGPGSFLEAVSRKGPRIVVFEVGGVIDLGEYTVRITEPFLTIAGQTAPTPGITLIRGGIDIATHDVVVRHIRVRPGDGGRARLSGGSPRFVLLSPDEAGIHDWPVGPISSVRMRGMDVMKVSALGIIVALAVLVPGTAFAKKTFVIKKGQTYTNLTINGSTYSTVVNNGTITNGGTGGAALTTTGNVTVINNGSISATSTSTSGSTSTVGISQH